MPEKKLRISKPEDQSISLTVTFEDGTSKTFVLNSNVHSLTVRWLRRRVRGVRIRR